MRADTAILQESSLKRVLADYYELTKPGITFTVLASMWVGFLMGAAGSIDYLLLANATLGTWLIASGTAAHNMYMERRYDGLMQRTKHRPLPAGRIREQPAFLFSIGSILAGFLYLTATTNLSAGLVSLVTTILYLGVYTPLKRISALNVFVGAIPGALPAVGGWAAASGTIFEHGLWILFGIVFCWQIPHVMAIAWVCRKDYEHAGYQMLPKRDNEGWITSLWVNIPILILFPTVWKLYVMGLAGSFYLAGALLTTAGFLIYGIRFMRSRDRETARALMFASIAYLPLIWILVLIDWMV